MSLTSNPDLFAAIEQIVPYTLDARRCVCIAFPTAAQLDSLLRLPLLVEFERRELRFYAERVVRIFFKKPVAVLEKEHITIQFTYPQQAWFHDLIGSKLDSYELYEDSKRDYEWLSVQVNKLAFATKLNTLHNLLLEDD